MRILISGGGIAGLALAWWLRRGGHECLIVEKAPGRRGEGYMIDFFGAGYDAADEMGLLPALEQVHYPIDALTFLDAAGRERAAVPYPKFRKMLDGRHFNFMRGDLEQVLARADEGPDIRFGTEIRTLEQHDDHVSVTLSDGTGGDCDLVVGADGVHSHVRRLVFGDERQFSRDLACHTAAWIVDEPIGRLGNVFAMMTVPNRQVAVYPIRGNRTATFLLHRVAPGAPVPSGAAAIRELRAAYGDLGWLVPDLLARVTDRLYFDAVLQIEMPTWRAGRVVLLGDACQCVSLLAGQGASMAMTGAYVLARELGRAPDVPAALERYEQVMRPHIARKQAAGRRMARWFIPPTDARIAFRNLLMRMAGWPIVSGLLKSVVAPTDRLATYH